MKYRISRIPFNEQQKVVHVITGLGNGGAEAVLFRTLTATPEINHHVISLTSAGHYGKRLIENGIQVTVLGLNARNPLALWRLYEIIRREMPDSVQTWMYHADFLGGLAARLNRVRNVYWSVHHGTPDIRHDRRSTIKIAQFCASLSSKVPKRIVFVSNSNRDAHIAFGYEAGRSIVIPNGVDTAVFRPDLDVRKTIREDWGFKDDVQVVGCVARWHPVKDHKTLINAMSCLAHKRKDLALILAGPDMDKSNPALESALSELTKLMPIRLLGPQQNIARVLQGLDLHVLPSLGEAFGNTTIEALACGSRAVMSDTGIARETLPEELIFPPGNLEALAECIHNALESPPIKANVPDIFNSAKMWRQLWEGDHRKIIRI